MWVIIGIPSIRALNSRRAKVCLDKAVFGESKTFFRIYNIKWTKLKKSGKIEL